MEVVILIAAGFMIGGFGTLIGAGGGFILVPLLLLYYPHLSPETVTAISMAVVSINAISGTVAYTRSKRIDYRAGIEFAAFTLPGSIIGALTVQYIPHDVFNVAFSIILILLAIYLFFKNRPACMPQPVLNTGKGYKQHNITDREGTVYTYSYKSAIGNAISTVVGFISPILGIGGGIIHVPAMVNCLKFPVHIATATSHFILAFMTTATVITHAISGTYNDPEIQHLVLFLALGVIPGAQVGAYFSHKIKSHVIIRALSLCIAVVGIRILLKVL